jgi:hypothetical protein
MSSLIDTLLSQAARGTMSMDGVVSDFTPTEIRQTISDLVSRDELTLANAVSDAGLSLYPASEDILAVSALLAEIQRDWASAEQLLEQLIEIQQQVSTPFVWRHLIRVQRCHFEPAKALQSALRAVAYHPHDADLAHELTSLQEMLAGQTVLATPSLAQ